MSEIKLSPDHKGAPASIYIEAGTNLCWIKTVNVSQNTAYRTPEAAAQAWNEGSIVEELVEALESAYDIIQYPGQTPDWQTLQNVAATIKQALKKAKGLGK